MKIISLVTGVIQENCYLVYDEKDLVIVDPGAEADKIKAAIKKTSPRHRIHLPKLQPAADVHRRTEHSHAIDLGWSETRPTVVV